MIIDVKVKPNSRKQGIEKKDGVYIVSVKAPAKKGKANKETVKLLENYFSAKARIVSGMTSRKKKIEIIQ